MLPDNIIEIVEKQLKILLILRYIRNHKVIFASY